MTEQHPLSDWDRTDYKGEDDGSSFRWYELKAGDEDVVAIAAGVIEESPGSFRWSVYRFNSVEALASGPASSREAGERLADDALRAAGILPEEGAG